MPVWALIPGIPDLAGRSDPPCQQRQYFDGEPASTGRLAVRRQIVAFHLPDYTGTSCIEALHLAKPNYSFEKRQREIAKKKEKDEKDARKRQARDAAKPGSDDTASDGTAAADGAGEPSSAG